MDLVCDYICMMMLMAWSRLKTFLFIAAFTTNKIETFNRWREKLLNNGKIRQFNKLEKLDKIENDKWR